MDRINELKKLVNEYTRLRESSNNAWARVYNTRMESAQRGFEDAHNYTHNHTTYITAKKQLREQHEKIKAFLRWPYDNVFDCMEYGSHCLNDEALELVLKGLTTKE